MARRKTRTPRRRLTPVSDGEIDTVLAEALAAKPAQTAAASPLHELFNQQVRAVIDAADLDEEEKQSILVAMACPCCGGSAGSLTYKLKRRK